MDNPGLGEVLIGIPCSVDLRSTQQMLRALAAAAAAAGVAVSAGICPGRGPGRGGGRWFHADIAQPVPVRGADWDYVFGWWKG